MSAMFSAKAIAASLLATYYLTQVVQQILVKYGSANKEHFWLAFFLSTVAATRRIGRGK